jgi:hypothetical protein
MKLRHLLILGLSSLVMVGCVREVSKNQANESPIAVNASVPVSSTQAKPLGKSTPGTFLHSPKRSTSQVYKHQFR